MTPPDPRPLTPDPVGARCACPGHPRGAPTAILEAERVSKWFGEVLGLSDVSLVVGNGITGLLGPNGAGKSTFLKIITGQLKPSRGSVRLLGMPVWSNPDLNRQIGFCPEQDSFEEFMTGHEWLSYLAELSGFVGADARRRTVEVLEAVDLVDAARKRINQFSKGMRQRLKLAQALLHNPRVLILDEPLQGTDPLVRRKLVDLILGFLDQGRHLLVSSHILHEVELLTNRIVLIHQGRVKAEGSFEEVRSLLTHVAHHVRIECDRARELAMALWLVEGVVEVHCPSERVLIARTENPSLFYRSLPDLALDGGFHIERYYSPDDSLEAIFKRLTGRGAAEHGSS